MSNQTQRKQHVEVLLHLLTADADTIRHHIRGKAHNPTLGSAAESGVKELLRRHLPKTLAVTSGFVRRSDALLLEPGDSADLSGQTDIIVYDATRVRPFYVFEGIEIVAAEDVLAVIEVKDSDSEEGVLHKGDKSALLHMKQLASFAPEAFRAIVLFQGGDPSAAKDAVEQACPSPLEAPHAIYCRAYDEKKESYLGFLDECGGCFRVHSYREDRGSPLVGFLRMLVGYMTARGLMSGALLPALSPYAPQARLEHRFPGSTPIPSLYDEVVKTTPSLSEPFRKKFERYLRQLHSPPISVFPCPGLDSDEKPTVGSLLRVVEEADDGHGKTVVSSRASLFCMNKRVGTLECVGASKDEPWQIMDEPLVEYVRRTLPNIDISCKRG